MNAENETERGEEGLDFRTYLERVLRSGTEEKLLRILKVVGDLIGLEGAGLKIL